MDAYETALGCTPESCAAERDLLLSGAIDAIAFSSTAEVRPSTGAQAPPLPACPLASRLEALHTPALLQRYAQALGLRVEQMQQLP